MKEKNSSKSHLILMIVVLFTAITFTLSCFVFAWFDYSKSATPNLTAGIVKGYFDADSDYSGTDDGSGNKTYTYIITKASHLYNLAFLTNLGIFQKSDTVTYKFQLGKQKADHSTDTGYYVYQDEFSDESTDPSYTSIDMTTYNSGVIPPIGTTSDPFTSYFTGNDITISKAKIAQDSSSPYVGFFGVVGDKAQIVNFNLDQVEISTSDDSNASVNYAGLVVGDLEITTTTGFKIEGIGVKDGVIKGSKVTKSELTFIGTGSSTGLKFMQDGYVTTTGDTGVMYADEVLSKLDKGTIPNGDSNNFKYNGSYYYLNSSAWLGSDGSFGIFNLTSGTDKTAYGQYFTSYGARYYYKDYSKNTISSTGESLYYSSTTPTEEYMTFGSTTDEYAQKFVNSDGEMITSASSQLYFEKKIDYSKKGTVNDYDTSPNNTSTKYYNALIFEIHNDNGGEINFICCMPKDKINADRYVGLWMLDSSSSTTSDGSISSNNPNIMKYQICASEEENPANRTVAFTFKLPKGKYLIGSAGNGLYFNYVSVSGQKKGQIGDTTSGIPMDFISSTSQKVWYVDSSDSTNSYHFSKVVFVIDEKTATSFYLTFARDTYGDASSNASHVTLTSYYDQNIASIYSSGDTIATSLYTITVDSGSPSS